MEKYFTYITYNYLNNLATIGVTNNLKRRLKLLNQINNKNQLKLVYFEEFSNSISATQREAFFKYLQSDVLSEFVLENNPMLINLIVEI